MSGNTQKIGALSKILNESARDGMVSLESVTTVLAVIARDLAEVDQQLEALAARTSASDGSRDTSPEALAWNRELETLRAVLGAAARPGADPQQVEQCALGTLLVCTLDDPLLLLAVTQLRLELERRGYELPPVIRRRAAATLAPEEPQG